MIECIFTIDYEIYGNGTGLLGQLVYEPTQRLRDVFRKWCVRFVNFVEVAEIEKIEEWGTDSDVERVKTQIRELYDDGFEIALHLHPQWCNARYAQGRWDLDDTEYNLCTLPETRINQIVDRSLAYLRHLVGGGGFTPLSFRAGNWLFQPTHTAASVLAKKGIKIDSSVFKGGLQHNHKLDYRRSLSNGYYWPFSSDANVQDPMGQWIEVPIYTEMVPLWKIVTAKRLARSSNIGAAGQNAKRKMNRALDFMRFQYPLKFDFCRLTLEELTTMMNRVIRKDRENPEVYKPMVAIGHSKDLMDLKTVDAFLSFLKANEIPVSTFEAAYPKLANQAKRVDYAAALQ